jgi:glycerophosphoryl diester phosphodiesterase
MSEKKPLANADKKPLAKLDKKPYYLPLSARQLVAHRGYQQLYPENTARSVIEAINAGALYVEIDIQLSQDQQPLVYHDISLQRVSGCPGSVTEFSLQALQKLPAYEPERLGAQFKEETISSLKTVVEIIRQHPAITLFVELKEESIKHYGAATMLAVVTEVLQPIAKRAVLISFDYNIIQSARTQGWPQVGVVLRDWSDIDSTQVMAIEGEYTFVNYTLIPQDRDLTKLTSKLVAYEVGTVELARKLSAENVEMLETFDIKGLLGNRNATGVQ